MANLTRLASSQIREIVLASLGRLVTSGKAPSEPLPDFRVEIPADKSHGDFAVNTAMVCAKAFKNRNCRSGVYQLFPRQKMVL